MVDFNPRSPDGERPCSSCCALSFPNFNPRSPDGERLPPDKTMFMAEQFQSTLPGWGATCRKIENRYYDRISIHAPRMGSDNRPWRCPPCLPISIHAPRMGSDRSGTDEPVYMGQFQSTLPGWGATAKMDIFAHDMGKIIHFQH